MIRHAATFDRYPPANYDGRFHWDYLKPAWRGTRVEPMDVDGMVERFGAFLLFETKDPDCELPEGQRIALAELAKYPEFTIIHCAKTPEQVNGFQVWGPVGIREEHTGNAAALVKYCGDWFDAQRRR